MADWSGEFGDAYTGRNSPDARLRAEFFTTLSKWDIDTAFEVGCNIGTNMIAVEEGLGCEVSGCDINEKALEKASDIGLEVYYQDATDLDHSCGEFDLVFTCGVLIHLNTPQMIRCMKEMHRISTGLVMFMEYKGNDIEIPYRGQRGALIKREYGDIFQALFPEAELMETGFLPKEMGFDDITYWVFYDTGDSTGAYGIDKVPWKSDEESNGEVIAATLTGEIGAVRVDRQYNSGNWAWAGK